MTSLRDEVDRLQLAIGQADPITRYKHEPDLRHAMDRLRANDVAVPEQVKRLHQILLSEAIEAEFDNMPV